MIGSFHRPVFTLRDLPSLGEDPTNTQVEGREGHCKVMTVPVLLLALLPVFPPFPVFCHSDNKVSWVPFPGHLSLNLYKKVCLSYWLWKFVLSLPLRKGNGNSESLLTCPLITYQWVAGLGVNPGLLGSKSGAIGLHAHCLVRMHIKSVFISLF